MGYNLRLVIAVVLIIAISWLDYQYFMEDSTAVQVSDGVRKACHVLSLLAVAIIGSVAWKPVSKMVFMIWTGTYGLAALFIGVIGMLNWALHFSDDLLNEVSRFRVFFCSPMPFAALYIFYRLFSKKSTNQ